MSPSRAKSRNKGSKKSTRKRSARAKKTAEADALRPLEAMVFLRRLRKRPGQVADAEVLGRCERAALAAALRLRAEMPLSLTAVAVGPASREDRVLAVALRAGCDRAVRVFDDDIEALDYYGIAEILAAAARSVDAALLLCGDRSQDELQGAIGPAVAEILEIPHLSGVIDVAAEDASVVAVQRSGGKHHRYRCRPPVLLCVGGMPRGPSEAQPASEASTPRQGAPRQGMIEERDLDGLGLDRRELHYRAQFVGRARPRRGGVDATLARDARDLVTRLAEGHLIA